MIEINIVEDFFIFNCPHSDCNLEIIVHKNELNCKIFRHAYYKNNFQQVNPHLNFEECERLKKEDLVYGCCKPFEILFTNNKFYVQQCEYK